MKNKELTVIAHNEPVAEKIKEIIKRIEKKIEEIYST